MENKMKDLPTYEKTKEVLVGSRVLMVILLDTALESGVLTQRERDIMYFRHVDWNSLARTGKQFGLSRGRIGQIEAMVEEKFRQIAITNGKSL